MLSRDDLVTQQLQANEHPPLATSPHLVGPSASSTKSSTNQKSCTALYRQNIPDGNIWIGVRRQLWRDISRMEEVLEKLKEMKKISAMGENAVRLTF